MALLGDAATQQFLPILGKLFADNDISAVFYEGAFDAVELEAVAVGSTLYSFQPDAILLLNCLQSLRAAYYRRPRTGEEFLAATKQRLSATWDAIQANSSALLVQFNFVLPFERHFGNYDHKVPGSLYTVTAELNRFIATQAQSRTNFLVCDVEALASWMGRKHWFDERLWDLAKSFCALENVPVVAQNIVEIILSNMGRVIKCVILDLDNTLWSGIVGDDGPEGIKINAHGEGEAFHRFQTYLLELKKRGILLCVCSKNEYSTAICPFIDNSEMALKENDITMFVANWENKADNIRKIKETLDIGFDSMVFLDDNPCERNLVRQLLPGVIVPDLPEDPSDYVRAISELNLFETSSFSAEDLRRVELYRQEASRRVVQQTYSSIEDYLQSLEMVIEVERFNLFYLPRIAQLIQRSNQFNLTTRRHNQGECERMMHNERCIPLYAKLKDRFGDHGLISIVVACHDGDRLMITDWLMSCRVLSRGVEQFLMNTLVEEARRLNLPLIAGQYIPTSKNGMVRDFYARFGFQLTAEDADGRTTWTMATTEFQPKKVFILRSSIVAAN